MASSSGIYGYLYCLDEDQLAVAIERSTFTEVFATGEIEERQLALLFDFVGGSEHLQALAVLRRGPMAATRRRVARFDAIRFVEPPLDFDDIGSAAALGEEKLVRLALDAGRVTPKALLAVCRAIVNARPELANDLADLLQLLQPDDERLGDRDGVVAFERDAFGVAMELAGMTNERVDQLAAWRAPTSKAPFLQGLSTRSATEDQMIANDLRVFGNWAEIDDGDPLAIRFASGDRVVTIANVNRLPVESSTGADLIYYSHDWDAYVLVQYKRMTREPKAGWVFRPSTAGKLDAELANLRKLPGGAEADGAKEYRLSDEAGYLKLCRQMYDAPGSRKLAAGVYLPVSLYDLQVDDPTATGERGGTRLALSEMDNRWLSGETFIDLVRRGFIGSRGASTAAITEQIRDALERGRSVTIAAGGKAVDRSR